MRLKIKTAKLQNHIEPNREREFIPIAPDLNRVQSLTEDDCTEILGFLAVRPVHTVVMTGFIRDNGIESSDNRGEFYAYRDHLGNLEGVALIGHTTLIEARSNEALAAFARIARQSKTPLHVMMSDGRSIETFWQYFAGDINRKPRLVCTELLFELGFPFFSQECDWDIRPAEAAELDQIAEAHAEVALIESGVNPLEKDREGFIKRCLKRIEKNRTFVVFDNGKLVFKADIIAETDKVIYLEGVYVAPEYRGRSVGSSCLAKLSLALLNRVEHICLLSNVDFAKAHKSFVQAGFINTDQCQTIFV